MDIVLIYGRMCIAMGCIAMDELELVFNVSRETSMPEGNGTARHMFHVKHRHAARGTPHARTARG